MATAAVATAEATEAVAVVVVVHHQVQAPNSMGLISPHYSVVESQHVPWQTEQSEDDPVQAVREAVQEKSNRGSGTDKRTDKWVFFQKSKVGSSEPSAVVVQQVHQEQAASPIMEAAALAPTATTQVVAMSTNIRATKDEESLNDRNARRNSKRLRTHSLLSAKELTHCLRAGVRAWHRLLQALAMARRESSQG